MKIKWTTAKYRKHARSCTTTPWKRRFFFFKRVDSQTVYFGWGYQRTIYDFDGNVREHEYAHNAADLAHKLLTKK